MLEECTVTERGTHLCPGGEEIFVRNVYPPIQELQPRVLAVVVIFTLCLVVGVCGNASVLTLIYGITRGNQLAASSARPSKSSLRRSTDNTMLYIAALCVVDFLMSMSLPPAILDSIIGFWMFGTPICKLHHICGSVGRIVSTFLITALSFDRWVAVCHPYKRNFRSRKFVITTIFALWTLAFLLLLPMLTYARANEILLHQLRQPDQRLSIVNITRVRVFKCSDMLPPVVFYWFTSSTFVLGYCVPLVLIIYFNSRLIRKLYRHTKQLRSGIPLRQITIYTSLIAALYFICWTPYWCTVLYAIWMSAFAEDGHSESTSDMLLFIIYCLHLLPYLGSATNWILYGLLNTQLQIRQYETMNKSLATQPADDDWTNVSVHHKQHNQPTDNNHHQLSSAINFKCIPNGHVTIANATRKQGKTKSKASLKCDKSLRTSSSSNASTKTNQQQPNLLLSNGNDKAIELISFIAAAQNGGQCSSSNCSLTFNNDVEEEDQQL
ncbi:hypothetical protein niasHS_000922 [Heterodera schachtii]|uniref:G-protein coupled receptors family 1 profile domain-containing protein n=1 Tax=Heterodera schachtii TaxID=97005 RepID=A0ABD2K8P4_HETSC